MLSDRCRQIQLILAIVSLIMAEGRRLGLFHRSDVETRSRDDTRSSVGNDVMQSAAQANSSRFPASETFASTLLMSPTVSGNTAGTSLRRPFSNDLQSSPTRSRSIYYSQHFRTDMDAESGDSTPDEPESGDAALEELVSGEPPPGQGSGPPGDPPEQDDQDNEDDRPPDQGESFRDDQQGGDSIGEDAEQGTQDEDQANEPGCVEAGFFIDLGQLGRYVERHIFHRMPGHRDKDNSPNAPDEGPQVPENRNPDAAEKLILAKMILREKERGPDAFKEGLDGLSAMEKFALARWMLRERRKRQGQEGPKTLEQLILDRLNRERGQEVTKEDPSGSREEGADADASADKGSSFAADLEALLRRGFPPGFMRGGPERPQPRPEAESTFKAEEKIPVSFADVAGCDAAKFELTEVVDFLKNPAKYTALGAKIPRGVLMEGPPGTGKTLLARAVAGEAGVPFIYASASAFIEMYVGVGAARIRNLFGKAKSHSPCIVFIDEIDAVGRQRGGSSNGNDGEREQTLNQFLNEMDGFEGNTGVIVMAATNRAEVLDEALIRPGRFDRRIPVDLPDVKGRHEILQVHTRNKPLAPDLDLRSVAMRTTGFSGAALESLMNEAAIVAARNDKVMIFEEDVDYAIDRQTVGLQKRTGMNFRDRRRLVAVHEAGHAIMGLLTPDYDTVTKVTIIPRSGGTGGFTLFTPSEEQLEMGMYTYQYLCSQLAVALGGRVAEEIVYGKDMITTGASNDLQHVRSLARRMVAQWGFASDALGDAPVAWETPDGSRLLNARTLSAQTETEIDQEVKALVQRAYNNTKTVLTENRDFLARLAERLMAEETLDFPQLAEMRNKFAADSAQISAAIDASTFWSSRADSPKHILEQEQKSSRELSPADMPRSAALARQWPWRASVIMGILRGHHQMNRRIGEREQVGTNETAVATFPTKAESLCEAGFRLCVLGVLLLR